MSTPKEFMEAFFRGERKDRIPFAPAVYEHKAFLISETPSKVSRDPELFHRALLTEYSSYRPDLLTVGMDVYNIEPEAFGCEVKFYPNSSDVPVISKPIVETSEDVAGLRVPDPHKEGRMPMMLEVGRKTLEDLRTEVIIRGAVSGPFTMASHLGGQQKMIMETYRESNFAEDLLELSTRTAKRYARAWIEAGLEVIVFDSLASPPLISPDIYSRLIKPYHDELFDFLNKFGLNHKPLIIGGDTTSIAKDLAEVGSDFLLCDYNADLGVYLDLAKEKDFTLRVNLDPDWLVNWTPDELESKASEVVGRGKELVQFILGTGVLVYNTPRDNVLAVRRACKLD